MPGSTTRRRTPRFSRLRGSIGVTRVARITGLDRTGVEVACAIRPRGHVLQVSNGKGETRAEAERGAVLEAAELAACERPPAGRLPLAGAPGLDLISGQPVLVPARAVWCPAPGARRLGGPPARWTSNGMGAHPSRDAALLHALLEAVERDQVARALPGFWTRRAVARRMIDRRSLARGAPRAARLARHIEGGGFEAYLFDLSPNLDGCLSVPGPSSRSGSRPGSGSGSASRSLGLPVAGALVFDLRPGPVPVAAGYACALSPDGALRAALLEAAQSRLTDIHGAREDIQPMDPRAADLLLDFCREVRPRRRARRRPATAAGPGRALAEALRRLRRAGVRCAAAVDLPAPGPGVHVVKVVVPGFRLSELL